MRLKGTFLNIEKRVSQKGTEFAVAEIDDGQQPNMVSIWSKTIMNEWAKLKQGDKVECEIIEKGDFKNMQESIVPKVERESTQNDMDGLKQLLQKAHKKAKKMDANLFIDTKEKIVDYEKCYATFNAKVSIVQDNRVLTTTKGHGHARKDDLNENMKEYWYVMAETRALVRALRWLTNTAAAGKEEINKK